VTYVLSGRKNVEDAMEAAVAATNPALANPPREPAAVTPRRKTPKRVKSPAMPPSPEQRIKKLRDEINHHNALYYQEARPEISDRDLTNSCRS
jgi:hypothetical protein